jgi:murein DD-endopeptidase MepM/ murein hydrolase activator NlpD
LAIAISVSVGACSADVTRFDYPAFNLNSDKTGSLPPEPLGYAQRRDQSFDLPPGAPPRGIGAAGEPAAPYRGPQPGGYQGGYQGDRVASRDFNAYPGPHSAPLPPIEPERRPAYNAESAPGAPPERSRAAAEPAYAPERPSAAAGRDTIQVEQGDTLYGIAKRYNVSLADLIEANGLHHGVSLKPGQQLVLPAGAVARHARAEARAAARAPVATVPVAKVSAAPPPALAPVAAAPPMPATTATAEPPAPAGWQGRHVLKQGESLYGIARQHNVTLAELQRVNGITNPLRVRAGTTLMVPGTAEGPVSEAGAPAMRLSQTPPATPRIINAPAGGPAETKVAARNDQATDAASLPAAPVSTAAGASGGGGQFRWPVRGRVVAAYGKRPDGTHNDGINLAVPMGTEVHAAESGKVAYAGNELKGYGNLILIRHDNGWVSAYAHNDQLLVKRDDVVRRGQVIAKAGKTGTVDQPQLHFELRQGSKPVDPLPHLEK